MNLFDRFIALFSSPSEAFEGLNENPLPTSQIIISLSISIIAMALMSFWVYTTPEIKREIFNLQKEKIEQNVTDGSMSQSDADMAIARIESVSESSFGTIITVVSSIIMVTGWFFLLAVYFLLFGKFFGSVENYSFSVTLSAISVLTLFYSLISLVSSALVIITGTLNTNLGPVLLLADFDSKNSIHKMIVSADLLVWFYMFLMMLGFKITSKSSWQVSALIILIPYLLVKAYQIFF